MQAFSSSKIDGFVKSPTSVLRCILRHCDVPVSTPHSSGFARLEFEAFYFVARFPTFYGTININSPVGEQSKQLMPSVYLSVNHKHIDIHYIFMIIFLWSIWFYGE